MLSLNWQKLLIVAAFICLFFFVFLKKIEKTEEKSSSITVQCLNVEVENKLWENYVKNPNEYNAREMDDFFNNCSMRGHVYRISDNKSRCERNQSVTISIAELGDFHRQSFIIDKNLENKIDCDAPILSKSICEKWVLSYPGSPISYKKNPETLFLDEVKNTLPENRKSLFYFYAIPPEKIEKYKGEAIKACANLSK